MPLDRTMVRSTVRWN